MRRRQVLQLAAAMLGFPAGALAQAPKRSRIGCLYIADEATVRVFHEALLAGLRDLGYVAGRNLVVDVRYALGDSARMSALADELIALKPDVLVGIEAVALVMKSKTATIPIVLPTSIDPVAAGLVRSLRRPGTNVTGLANMLDALLAKHVELLTEIVPKIARIALFNDPLVPAAPRYEQLARAAATAKGLSLIAVGARDVASVAEAFAPIEKERVEGLVVIATGRTNLYRHAIIDRTRRLRLPAVSGLPSSAWADAGGLVTYAPNFVESYREAATYVDRILKGAQPAELPVQQPTRFDFVVNLKTAHEIGVTIPRSVLLRAERVIE